jgi:DNA (cytosine-5)-methyltransferase 1
VLSLFSGAGGFDWGFHRAGFSTLLACELTPDAAHTLAHNLKLELVSAAGVDSSCLPAVIQGDIEEVNFARISLRPDVLIGGPPCQDFSVSKAHERQGLNGGRGQLYREFVRAVMYFQPKVFVFENVPGLLSANHGLAYSTILGDLRHLETTRRACLADQASYSVPESTVEDYIILFSDIVDAVKLGVPQVRRRLIIIGLRRDLFDAFLPTDQGAIINRLELQLNGVGKFFARYPLTSLEALEGKPLPDLQNEYRSIMEAYSDIVNSVSSPKVAAWKTEIWDRLSFDIVKDYLNLQQLDNAFAFTTAEFDAAMRQHENLLRGLDWLGHPVSKLKLPDGTTTPIAQGRSVVDRMYYIPPDENADFVVGTPWEVESKGISFIYRRTGPLKPAMTVMAYGGGGTHGYHYSRNRISLTLLERARIQTFTDDFMFTGKNIRAQIGEAVPPLLGECIAEAVREVLEYTV